jgi:two-component system nitrate/nitrite response regulator NarL
MALRLSTALIGPNTLFREGLRRVLHPTPYQIKKVAETIDSVQQSIPFDLTIFLAGADEAALLDQMPRAKEKHPGTRVVVMDGLDSTETAWRLLAAGADGYLLKTISFEALLASLDAVMLGATVVSQMPKGVFPAESNHSRGLDEAVSAQTNTNPDPEYKKLSERETAILLCLMKGASNKVIARQFDIAEATVKVHLKAILRKIHVSNRTQAAVWAHSNHLAFPTHLPMTGPAEPAAN